MTNLQLIQQFQHFLLTDEVLIASDIPGAIRLFTVEYGNVEEIKKQCGYSIISEGSAIVLSPFKPETGRNW